MSLDAGDLFDKVVRQRRGGFCYELNGLFALFLEQTGHSVVRLAARVGGGERLGPPYDHLVLLVNGQWLADTADGDVWVLRDGERKYLIETRPRDLADFRATCWFQQTSPESHFTRKTICSRLTRDGRVTISDRTLIVTGPHGRSETVLDGEEELREAYRAHFGIQGRSFLGRVATTVS